MVADALVVNTGELLKQWPNIVVSVKHSCTPPGTRRPLLIPFFFNANADWLMCCPPAPMRHIRLTTHVVSYRQSQAAAQVSDAPVDGEGEPWYPGSWDG